MRGSPEQTVAVVPTTGLPPLYALVLYAPTGGGNVTLTVEFCDDKWRPLAAAANYALNDGVTATLGTLAGGPTNIPAGATRIKAFTDKAVYYNLSGGPDWAAAFQPGVNQIPANSEFDFPEVQ